MVNNFAGALNWFMQLRVIINILAIIIHVIIVTLIFLMLFSSSLQTKLIMVILSL